MAREDKLVERVTYLTKIALGEEPKKDFSEAILQAAIKAAKMGYSFAVDEAAEWLDYHLTFNVAEWDEGVTTQRVMDKFRKAMKGD